ncbi:hypothetical protein [Mycolicibacterium houstonense]|uniref:hypothetical protein n=1 Tax=Mycolicibacterium houstonense TaxID=146021 RepID=UPI003F9E4785
MGELQGIGYGGQPTSAVFRPVDPAQGVLVDLIALFPREPHSNGRYQPFGMQMHRTVEGQLSCWGLCEQGHWWGLVTYLISFGPHERPVTHWIPAWVLRPDPSGQAMGRRQGHRPSAD